MEGLANFIVFLILLSIGYFSGTAIEKRHYRSILNRERLFLKLPTVSNQKTFSKKLPIAKAELVTGSCVVSLDYFKRFLANLKGIFGGEIGAYETLIDRARREAILRMKQDARGADVILNFRIETSQIGNAANEKNALGSIEVLAYGTAVTVRK